MFLSKIFGFIGDFIVEFLLGQLFYSAVNWDFAPGSFWFMAMVGGVAFFVTLAVARVIGTKSWLDLRNRPLFTKRSSRDATVLSTLVVVLYLTLLRFEIDPSTAWGVRLLLLLPVYGVWIQGLVKQNKSGSKVSLVKGVESE